MKSGKIFIALSVAFALVSAVFITMTVLNFKKEENPQAETEKAASSVVVSADVNYDAPSKILSGIVSNNAKKTEFPKGILEELKPAYAVNNDLAGFLSIPGTELSTAVVKAEDNNRYLKKDFYNRNTSDISETNYGNVYLDYRCGVDYLSKNMVLYGHTTGRLAGVPKQAFRSLYDFRDKKTFINSPIIKYCSLYKEYKYKICAVFLTTTEGSADGGYVFNYIYPDMSDANMVGYIEQVKQRMLYETDVSLEPGDSIITLSTCIYDYGKNVDTRLVVVGRLLHDGESESIDASLVKDNENYRRPQIWYNSKGIKNPYADSRSWKPSPD